MAESGIKSYFPSQTVSDAEKLSYDYGLKVAKAIETEWFNESCFHRTAENVNQYLTKGQKVYVEGRFQSREYVGQDGNQRKSFEVVANDVKFLNTKSEAESMGSKSPTNTEETQSDNSQNQKDTGKEEDLPW